MSQIGARVATSAMRPDAGSRFLPLRQELLPFARRHRGLLGRGLLFTCLLVASRLALPLPLTAIVARSTAQTSRPAVLAGAADPVALLAVGFVSLALVAGMAEHFQRLAFAHFAGRSISDARAAALARVGRIDEGAAGDLKAQVMADSARVKQGLKGMLNHIVLNGLLVLGACVALALADPQLGLIQFGGAGVVVVVAILGATRVARVAAEHRDGESGLAVVIHGLVAEGGRERTVDDLAGLHVLDAASGEADIDMTRWEGRTTCAVHVVLTLTAAVVLWFGVGSLESGRLGTGTLFTVVAYLLVLHGPGVRLARQITRIGPLLVSANQLGLVLVGSPGKHRVAGR